MNKDMTELSGDLTKSSNVNLYLNEIVEDLEDCLDKIDAIENEKGICKIIIKNESIEVNKDSMASFLARLFCIRAEISDKMQRLLDKEDRSYIQVINLV